MTILDKSTQYEFSVFRKKCANNKIRTPELHTFLEVLPHFVDFIQAVLNFARFGVAFADQLCSDSHGPPQSGLVARDLHRQGLLLGQQQVDGPQVVAGDQARQDLEALL
jgi:hypothetical protein